MELIGELIIILVEIMTEIPEIIRNKWIRWLILLIFIILVCICIYLYRR